MGRKKFKDYPFPYHQEIELEISTLTNLGVGLGRVPLDDPLHPGLGDLGVPAAKTDASAPRSFSGGGWVVMVPFSLPGERVRARVFRNHQNYSEADLVAVLTPSPNRLPVPRCPLFGRCGGCQYQHLGYAEQLEWKQRQVTELLRHMAGIEFAVAPVIGSPRQFGYRSKITPHFAAPARAKDVSSPRVQVPIKSQTNPETKLSAGSGDNAESKVQDPKSAFSATAGFPIGFLKQGSRFEIVDVPRCEIATDAINARLAAVRAEVPARMLAGEFQRGATVLLRDAGGIVTTDYAEVITEEIAMTCAPGNGSPTPPGSGAAPLRLKFLARDFFQNNPFILPAFAAYVRDQASASNARCLIDAYCGSGLFALASASCFERVAGIEVSETSVAFARENASANNITNASFLAGDAAAIFAGVDFPADDTVVVIDPPRKGCDQQFLQQLFSFGPRAVVYVSCDPATQMRDLGHFLTAGYVLAAVQPFDLFPQTRHLECVITLRKTPVAQPA